MCKGNRKLEMSLEVTGSEIFSDTSPRLIMQTTQLTDTGDTSSVVSEVDGFKLGSGSVTAARMGFECQSQLKPSVPRPILWPCILILKIRKNYDTGSKARWMVWERLVGVFIYPFP